MPRSARTALVSLVPAALVAAAWLRLEQPRAELWRPVALVALALAAGSARPLAARAAALVVAAGLAARVAFGLSPLDARPFDPHHDFFGPLWGSFSNGFLDFYDVRVPFDPRLHPDMRGVVLTAVFVFALLVVLAVEARRPVAATLALLVGAGWPATLMGAAHALAFGVAILLGSLVLLAGLTSRRVPWGVAPAACALALVALVLSSSPAVAKRGLVGWQTWDPYTRPAPAVSVSYVWNSQYLSIQFPARKTTVLEVAAPASASLYWRAAVLDDFSDDRWRGGVPRSADALEPPAAHVRKNQTKQVVTIAALADTRLVGGSEPIRFDAGGVRLDEPVPGTASLASGLTRGFRYTVWSYAPQPTPAELRRSPPVYPHALAAEGLLDVAPGLAAPAFGTPGQQQRALALVDSHAVTAAYKALAELAQEVSGAAPTPYDAAVSLESWFRSTGGFRYTNRVGPVYPNALVGFLTETRAGYCQYFAGAMALMLRYLGVPARVVVGFSSGTYDRDRGVWVVTDHDAHAWVEAWFAGYGWLPFDPTPTQGRPEQGVLGAAYSAASAVGGAGGPAGTGKPSPTSQTDHRHGGSGSAATQAAEGPAPQGSSSGSVRNALLALVALLLGATVGAIALTKVTIRSVRRLTRDPRRIAGSCRRELAAYLLDQRIEAAGSATLHELGALLRHELSVDADRFVAAATRARFGRSEGAGPAARDARRELRALLRVVRARLTGPERLRGLLSLRSLGLAR